MISILSDLLFKKRSQLSMSKSRKKGCLMILMQWILMDAFRCCWSFSSLEWGTSTSQFCSKIYGSLRSICVGSSMLQTHSKRTAVCSLCSSRLESRAWVSSRSDVGKPQLSKRWRAYRRTGRGYCYGLQLWSLMWSYLNRQRATFYARLSVSCQLSNGFCAQTLLAKW